MQDDLSLTISAFSLYEPFRPRLGWEFTGGPKWNIDNIEMSPNFEILYEYILKNQNMK